MLCPLCPAGSWTARHRPPPLWPERGPRVLRALPGIFGIVRGACENAIEIFQGLAPPVD